MEDGFCLSGLFVGQAPAFGEVVFTTAMAGYVESLTDPSYWGQILAFTFPEMGNYGVDVDQAQSERIQVAGAVFVRANVAEPIGLLSWLISNNVPVMIDVDVRRLTLHLRRTGTLKGALLPATTRQEAWSLFQEGLAQAEIFQKDWVGSVTCSHVIVGEGQKPSGPRVGIWDFGCKKGILKAIEPWVSKIYRFPAYHQAVDILSLELDALILSNGPSDPSLYPQIVKEISQTVGKLPIMAICLGHQLLSLSLGARTYRLKFGHRGVNHPVWDPLSERVLIVSHNHGYAVDPQGGFLAETRFVNLIDQSLAGFVDFDRRLLSVQFHPEAQPGPYDGHYLFEWFFQKSGWIPKRSQHVP